MVCVTFLFLGMVGAMVRHLVSLRRMKRDHGWIHTLLEEAANERMHLMTALRVANPGIFMRLFIAVAQGNRRFVLKFFDDMFGAHSINLFMSIRPTAFA